MDSLRKKVHLWALHTLSLYRIISFQHEFGWASSHMYGGQYISHPCAYSQTWRAATLVFWPPTILYCSTLLKICRGFTIPSEKGCVSQMPTSLGRSIHHHKTNQWSVVSHSTQPYRTAIISYTGYLELLPRKKRMVARQSCRWKFHKIHLMVINVQLQSITQDEQVYQFQDITYS